MEEIKFPQVRPEGCRHICHKDCLEEWIAKRTIEFPSCPSCRREFRKFILSKSETEEEEISSESIRKKDWRPTEYSPSYNPDEDPDNRPPAELLFFY